MVCYSVYGHTGLKSGHFLFGVKRVWFDGDVGFCRVCGSKHRLHRDGDSFTVEPTGRMGSAQELKPRPEINSIEAFIALAPKHVDI